MPTASLQWARSISEGVHIGTVFHFFWLAPFSPGQVSCLIPSEIIPDSIGLQSGYSGCLLISESLVEKLKAFTSFLVSNPWLYHYGGSFPFFHQTPPIENSHSAVNHFTTDNKNFIACIDFNQS